MPMLVKDRVYSRYLRPFSLVEILKLRCGYEKSFKLTDGHLLCNRYLLGIDKADLDDDKLSFICDQLEMPAQFRLQLSDHLADANLVLLGFEQGVEDCTYKIYLEYWDKVRSSRQPCDDKPETLFLGYKWSAFDNRRAALTCYRYFPALTVAGMIKRISSLKASDDHSATFDVAGQIVAHSAQRASSPAFRFLEATEADSPRKSFDINLYAAGLNLQDIYPGLKNLCDDYSVSIEELDRLFGRVGSCTLGHLSGGLDRKGKVFFSVYYEASTEASADQ
jgi:hypothetical protein